MTLSAQSRHDAPLLYAALGFAAGILLAHYCWRGPLWWTAAVLVFALGAAFYTFRRTRVAIALTLLTMLVAGGLAFTAREFHTASPDLISLDGRDVVLTAHVIRESPPRLRGAEESEVVDLETETIAPGPPPALRKPFQPAHPGPFGPEQPLHIVLRATLYVHEVNEEEESESGEVALPQLTYGQRVRVIAHFRLPRNFRNPGAFDYRGYLADHGISALASARADRVEMLPGFAGSRAGRWRSRIRNALLARIHALWPEHDAALLSAMLISERTLVSREARTDFQRSGTYHLLVVAGLHLGILAWFCYALLRRLRFGELFASMGTIAFASGYAYLADDGVPIWRATLMLSVYLAARLLYRPHAALNAIGAAALILLAIDPHSLFTASFQLSFTAVLAIVAIAAPLLERTSEPYLLGLRQIDSTAFDLHLPPRIAQFRIDLRMISSRLAQFVGARAASFVVVLSTWAVLRAFELIVLSIAMQLALALPTAWYFHRATTLSIAANLFVVPLAGVLLPAALIAIACSWIMPPIAALPAFIASAALHLVSRTTVVIGHVLDVRVATPSAGVIAACIATFVFAAIAVHRHRALAATALALFAGASTLPVIAPPTVQRRPGVLELTAIDVGQGEALLIITPDGHTLMIDSGGQLGPSHSEFDFGEDVIAPYLWSRGVRSLDAVALTHAHQDHIGGMRSLLADFHPRELWLGAEPDSYAVRSLVAEAHEQRISIQRLASPYSFVFGGSQVQVLAPLPGYQPGIRASNNDSLVLEIAYGGTRALLAGDIEKKVERELTGVPAVHPSPPGMYADLLPLLESSTRALSTTGPSALPTMRSQDLHADVLKVAHHGSATSTTEEFLAAVHPRFAVISAGFRNNFGHPRPEVLGRLEQSGVATYRTDTAGAITFYLDGKRVSVSTRIAGPDSP